MSEARVGALPGALPEHCKSSPAGIGGELSRSKLCRSQLAGDQRIKGIARLPGHSKFGAYQKRDRRRDATLVRYLQAIGVQPLERQFARLPRLISLPGRLQLRQLCQLMVEGA